MPAELQDGAWTAAFLAEPYVTLAGEDYGERELADLDQGATINFPIDGYMATQAWVNRYPKTAAAFVRAIEEGQALADNGPYCRRGGHGRVRQPFASGDRNHVAARFSGRRGG